MLSYTTIGTLDSSNRKPLGIFLHGFGDNAHNISEVAKYFTQSVEDWFIPNGTVDLSGYVGQVGYAWFPETQKEIIHALQGNYWNELALLDPPAFIRSARAIYGTIKELKLDQRQLVLAGFSQGAMLCPELAILLASSSITPSAMLLFSGALISKKRWNLAMNEQIASSLRDSTSIIQFHGENDTILPISEGRALYSFWKKHTNNIQFHSFNGGHTIPLAELAKVQSFLLEKLNK